MVKLIASDLDGTLLQNGAHDVNPIVFDQIRTLKEHGIMFAAANGRQYLNLRRLFTPVQDDIAYIAENGSLCIYNEETISKGIIEARILLTVSWMKLQNIHNTTASSPANVSATAPRKIRSSIITW